MIEALLLILGLCLGSFVNALAWRLHKGRNWVSERSECVHCHHQLAWNDLIPVVSWLWLRGKCRYCRKPIDDSPLAEAATAILFVGSYVYWPYEFGLLGAVVFGLWLVIIVGFMAMSVSDLKWMKLPNGLTAVFSGVAAAQTILLASLLEEGGILIGAVAGALLIGGVFYGLYQLSGGKWIGGGDVKLAFMLGLLAGGIPQSLLLIFLASTLGTVAALPLLIAGKKTVTQKMPFGPFLMGATVLIYLFGQEIIDWYQALLIL